MKPSSKKKRHLKRISNPHDAFIRERVKEIAQQDQKNLPLKGELVHVTTKAFCSYLERTFPLCGQPSSLRRDLVSKNRMPSPHHNQTQEE